MSNQNIIRNIVLPICICLGFLQSIQAQTLIESSVEVRYQLNLQVPQPALMRLIPDGWSLDIRTQGAAKDANLRVIFIERMSVNGADGQPVGDGSNQLVYLTVPAKDPAGNSVQLVIGEITEDPDDSPGPFGVYLPAAQHSLKREISGGSGPVIESQDWVFEAASGEFIKMNITFERSVGNRRPVRDRRYCSAKSPGVCQISRQEQMLDIMRNVTTNPTDRVSDFTFMAGGGSYAGLFDGTERLLSWDNILWLNQEIFSP